MCAYALGALPLGFVLYGAALYLAQALGCSQEFIGKVLWIPPLGWEAGYFVWGWLCDRGRLPMRALLLLSGALLACRSPRLPLAGRSAAASGLDVPGHVRGLGVRRAFGGVRQLGCMAPTMRG